jgi:hypothetical protein
MSVIEQESLNNINIEFIDNEYSYGQYGEFKVIIMRKNRYINATKLCKEYGKDFKNWKEREYNKELINEVNNLCQSDQAGKDENNKSIILIEDGDNHNIRGMYVHELLFPHIASWISPKFGIMVGKIGNNYMIDEYTRSIKEKDDKINKLESKINKLLKSNEKLLDKHNNMKETLK